MYVDAGPHVDLAGRAPVGGEIDEDRSSLGARFCHGLMTPGFPLKFGRARERHRRDRAGHEKAGEHARPTPFSGALHKLAPDPGRQPVHEDQQADGQDDDGQHRRALDRPDHHPLQQDAAGEGDQQRERERDPLRQPVLGEAPGDERREGRHLTLREVDDACGAVDDHDRQSETGIDRALADACGELLRELRPGERCEDHQ